MMPPQVPTPRYDDLPLSEDHRVKASVLIADVYYLLFGCVPTQAEFVIMQASPRYRWPIMLRSLLRAKTRRGEFPGVPEVIGYPFMPPHNN